MFLTVELARSVDLRASNSNKINAIMVEYNALINVINSKTVSMSNNNRIFLVYNPMSRLFTSAYN